MQAALLVLAILILLLVNSARFHQACGRVLRTDIVCHHSMMLLVSTQNLLVIFLTIEFLSLSLYVLTGFDKESRHLGGGRAEVFSVWRYVGGDSAVWHELALWDLRLSLAGRGRGRCEPFAGRSPAHNRSGHGGDGIWIQDRGRPFSHVGSRGIPGRAYRECHAGCFQFQSRQFFRVVYFLLHGA